ncbi:MAG: hypothetical protein CMG19_03275 [Candidatus Marinimicrobia bacterium]|nr:hypothetical protein [Candidatus Neomarinimicrobiota bacterium]|tara:strand:+ start:218 stop:658 length:441 start_codon:yes stop_codon:yes gene_type:complete
MFVFTVMFSMVSAGDVEDIKKQIMDNNEYFRKNKRGADEYSNLGALEFWSSGGLMQKVESNVRPELYDYVNLDVKHIEVIVLVPKKAAVAMYYSEGSMKPKNSAAVGHYLTRVTRAYVKEDGQWKVRASHWSPVMGGSGTSQTSLD